MGRKVVFFSRDLVGKCGGEDPGALGEVAAASGPSPWKPLREGVGAGPRTQCHPCWGIKGRGVDACAELGGVREKGRRVGRSLNKGYEGDRGVPAKLR